MDPSNENNYKYYFNTFEADQVGRLLGKFYAAIGDSTCSTPESQVLYFLNKSLRRLAQRDGLRDLFTKRTTVQLDPVNEDGSNAASWDLPKDLITICKLDVLDIGDSIKRSCARYTSDEDNFYACNPLPELMPCGTPSCYLIEKCGGTKRIVFDVPPSELMALNLKYNYCPDDLNSLEDKFDVPKLYCDLIVDGARIYHKEETGDFAQARALWESYDLHTLESSETFNRADKQDGYNVMAGGRDAS